MNELRLLISDALDRKLDDAEVERLEELLRSDELAMDRFVLGNFIHSHLIDWLGHDEDREVALAGDASGNGKHPGPSLVRVSDKSQPGQSQFAAPASGRVSKSALAWVAGLAATILVSAGIYAIASLAARPVIVGQLTQADACKWNHTLAAMPVGTLLEAGRQLELVEGRALVTLASGAQVLLQAPTSLYIESPMEVRIDKGEIAVKVPTHAIGFVASSSLARFIDLGTEFTLKHHAEKSFELWVFEGLVELQLDPRFGDAAPLRVAEVRAVRFDASTGDLVTLPFNEGQEMPF